MLMAPGWPSPLKGALDILRVDHKTWPPEVGKAQSSMACWAAPMSRFWAVQVIAPLTLFPRLIQYNL